MSADFFRMLFGYNYTLHDKVWDFAMALTDEQFTQDLNYSVGSIRNHFVHVMGVDARWMARIQGATLPPYPNYEDCTTRKATRAKWDEIRANILGFVGDLDDSTVARMVDYDMPHRGGMKRNSVSEILGHMVNHGTDHRGQMLAVLHHHFGIQTTWQDLVIYLWENRPVPQPNAVIGGDYFRTLYRYNYGIHEKLWECVMQLDEGDFLRELDYSQGSIRNQLVHVMSVDRRWIEYLHHGVDNPALNFEDYPTREAVREHWNQIRDSILEYIEGLDDAETALTIDTGRAQVFKSDLLAHVVNHGTDHRTQILHGLHRLGAPTIEQDLMLYLWSNE